MTFALPLALVALAWGQPPLLWGQAAIERDVRVAMTDGVHLALDVYRPAAPGRYPTLLERTPYGKAKSAEIGTRAHEYFPLRGYALIVQDVRGRGLSEGRYYPNVDDGWGERRDGQETAAWIARQPWSDGRVIAVGGSASGQTAYRLAATGAPTLAGLFVRESSADLHAEWFYRGGAFEHQFVTGWVASLGTEVVERAPAGPIKEAAAARLAGFKAGTRDGHRRLPVYVPPVGALDDGFRFYDDWLAHPAADAYWQAQDISARHAHFAVPGCHLGGWYDIFLGGTIRHFEGIRRNARDASAREGQCLIIGPWTHGPNRLAVDKAGDLTFPGAAIDINEWRLRRFEHWLGGAKPAAPHDAPVVIYVMGENRWRAEQEWPLARARQTRFHLRAGRSGSIDSLNDGTLRTEAPRATEPADRFVYDPADPVRTLGGNSLFGPDGPRDHRAADRRSLTYTSPPLTEDLEVTGPVNAVLFASSSAVDTDFVVRVSDVHPDGRSINIVDGIQRARYRRSPATAALLRPGQVERYEIDLWATSNVFKAGHRIRVSVTSSNFPRWDRNLNTAETPAKGTKHVRAENTIFHEPGRESHVVLPIVPR